MDEEHTSSSVRGFSIENPDRYTCAQDCGLTDTDLEASKTVADEIAKSFITVYR